MIPFSTSKRIGPWLFFFVVLCVAPSLAAEPLPIRALLITGGCCHDYENQKRILTRGISNRAPVEWQIVHEGGTTTDTKIPFYENPGWWRGFDVIVHHECFAAVTDPQWTQGILRAHREGVPALVIHCSMHCYRDGTDEWFKFLGVTSHSHGKHYPFTVVNVQPEHPAMKDFGNSWKTPQGELYLITKLGENTKPLAQARSEESLKDEVCIWTNEYGPAKTRVFGTTIGHYNEELSDPKFLNLITRGLLWAVGRDDPLRVPVTRKELVGVNVAEGKSATASASQDGHPPEHAIDNDPKTRWCGPNQNAGHWWQVDLEKPQPVTACNIRWESPNGLYQYLIEGSLDGKQWQPLIDARQNEERSELHRHRCEPTAARYVRITTTHLEGGWGSFWDVQVLGTETIEREVALGTSEEKLNPNQRAKAAFPSTVTIPSGYVALPFAGPPEVRYPTCLCATADGTVFVGIDENGSLGRDKTRAQKILRCIDTDHDGKADQFTTFVERVESPRGLIFDDGTLYVLHPPFLRAYHDDNQDGVADRDEVLVEGIGFDLSQRPADHTTNGIRMGIDGWIYIAVGDYGFVKAVGRDGKSQQLYGGGVARVRPDGTELEIVSRGQRNIYDVAIDSRLNLFTRDNTNDGGGWDVRLSHVIPTGQYGYPRLFKNFANEIIQPLADYGGGSPTGSLFVDEPLFGETAGNALYTAEWGRNAIMRHPLQPNGASFLAEQVPFVEMQRPTDLDVDAHGRMYIASWGNAGFAFEKPDSGFVICVQPTSYQPAAKQPPIRTWSDSALVKQIGSPSHSLRWTAQREILRRGAKFTGAAALSHLAADSARDLSQRIAALFTIAQREGTQSHAEIVKLCADATLREFALKALADRRAACADLPLQPFLQGLTDPDPRVRFQAAVGLGRIGRMESATRLLRATADPEPHVSHAAIHGLTEMRAIDACLHAVDENDALLLRGAVRVLSQLGEERVVTHLISALDRPAESVPVTAPDHLTRAAWNQSLLRTLCRLHFREADWDGKWWGTRPDTTGPYYHATTWEQSAAIASRLTRALAEADDATAAFLLLELPRHKLDEIWLPTAPPAGKVPLDRLLEIAARDAKFRTDAVTVLLDRNPVPDRVIPLFASTARQNGTAALRARALLSLVKARDHAAANEAAIEVLVDWSQQENLPGELNTARTEFLRDGQHAKSVVDWIRRANQPIPNPPRGQSPQQIAMRVLLNLVQARGTSPDVVAKSQQTLETLLQQPETSLSVIEAMSDVRADRFVFAVASVPEPARAAAERVLKELDIGDSQGPLIETLTYEDVVKTVMADKGKVARGERLFVRQGCVACHTTAANEALKGPALRGISERYKRDQLAESILRPNARIAQGFETQHFALEDGRTLVGFVVREAGEEIEIRDGQGQRFLIAAADIEARKRSQLSLMPVGLVDKLTPQDLAAMLSYLESLK